MRNYLENTSNVGVSSRQNRKSNFRQVSEITVMMAFLSLIWFVIENLPTTTPQHAVVAHELKIFMRIYMGSFAFALCMGSAIKLYKRIKHGH